MKDEPLVKGGCGHSDKEIEQSAYFCGFLILGAIGILTVALA